MNGDFLLRRISAEGEIEWQKSYGTDRSESVTGLALTDDGGCIAIGTSIPPDGSSADVWILRLTSTGEIEWQKRIGGTADDKATFVLQTPDRGYLVAGNSASFDPDNKRQLWITKLSPSGGIERQITSEYVIGDWPVYFCRTENGNVIASIVDNYTGDTACARILMVSSDGSIAWKKSYRLSHDDLIGQIANGATADGGCLLALNVMKVSPYYSGVSNANNDAHLLKLTASGEIEWQRLYGSDYSTDNIFFLRQANDGGYVVCGTTSSWAGMVEGSWAMRLRKDGTINPFCAFIKSAAATMTEEPDSTTEVQAVVEDTQVPPQPIDISVEAANFLRVSDPGVLYTLGASSCTLSLKTTEGGTTQPAPGTYVFSPGTEVTLRSIPTRNDYRWDEWVGNIIWPQAGVTVIMDGDKQIAASFVYNPNSDLGGGVRHDCFIATAAYGSPSHPHVKILRAFRDRYLARSRAGRSIVEFYYQHSPRLARIVIKHKTLRVASRVALFPAVASSYVLLRFGPAPAVLLALVALLLPWLLILRRRKRGHAPA